MAEPSSRTGLAAALGSFAIWGFAPLYWRMLAGIPPGAVVAHRVLWSAVLVGAVVLGLGVGRAELGKLREPRVLLAMLASTSLIVVNWFVFLWAIVNGRITEVSLGYYANPLYNVLLGWLFLRERIGPLQLAAVACASVSVAYMTWSLGELPWVSLVLALSFGTYGLVRKLAGVSALPGLAIETGICAPFCLGYLLFFSAGGQSPAQWGLLMLGGVVTASPLLLFAVGARRLRYSTLGMVQYLAPTLQLGVAVLGFGEPFTRHHAFTFAGIWLGVGLYALDALRSSKRA